MSGRSGTVKSCCVFSNTSEKKEGARMNMDHLVIFEQFLHEVVQVSTRIYLNLDLPALDLPSTFGLGFAVLFESLKSHTRSRPEEVPVHCSPLWARSCGLEAVAILPSSGGLQTVSAVLVYGKDSSKDLGLVFSAISFYTIFFCRF